MAPSRFGTSGRRAASRPPPSPSYSCLSQYLPFSVPNSSSKLGVKNNKIILCCGVAAPELPRHIPPIGTQLDGWLVLIGAPSGFGLTLPSAPGCQREFECGAAVNSVCLHPNQMELISGQQNGSVRIWNLSKNTCSRELVPSGEVAIRSVDIAPNGSTAVAANNDVSLTFRLL